MLSIQDLTIQIKDQIILDQISFQLQDNRLGAILGPSGSGKTSLLKSIIGFLPIKDQLKNQGQIHLNQQCISAKDTHIAVEHRQIGMMFQDLALFPHLTVFENIAFGIQALSQVDIHARVNQLLDLVELPNFHDRHIHQLSGGQQQRIALARALAPKPKLLLLDEPFSNLDADLKIDLAEKVKHILKSEQVACLLITHDQQEAFTFADDIGVMKDGKLCEWDTAYHIYHKPKERFVASFLGRGVFIPAKINLEMMRIESCLGNFPLSSIEQPPKTNLDIELLIRPDDIVHDDQSPVHAIVEKHTFKGAHILYHLKIPCKPTQAQTTQPEPDHHYEQVLCLAPSHHYHPNQQDFGIRLDLEHLVWFPKQI